MENSKAKILIAEDSAIQAEKLRRLLTAEGYTVLVAKDGAEGLVKARESKPNLVISDIMMPGMNGFELCQQIKKDPDLCATPVILLTSLSDPVDVINGLECGADNFIVKPYDEHSMVTRTRQLLLERELQHDEQLQMGVKIHFSGKQYFITSEKKQILELLFSTYESAVKKNRELIETQEELQTLNEQLEERVLERNAILAAEYKARAKAEEAVTAAAKEWEVSFNAMSDGVSIHSTDYLIMNANEALLQMLENGGGEVVGKKCYEVFHGQACPIADCPLSKANGPHKEVTTDIYEPTLDKWLTVTISPVYDSEKRLTRIVHTVRDITERKKLEEQLIHSQKMEVVGELSGGIAHDLNNILTAVVGFSTMIEMHMGDNNPDRDNIRQVLAAADRAAVLTKSLLTFSRKQILNKQPVDANRLIAKTEKFMRQVIQENISLRTIYSRNELIINADSGQIEQVLMNLATNARDAMGSGGIISIETESSEIDAGFVRKYGLGEMGLYAVITFSDNGKGMDPALCRKIFEPFFTTKEVGKGTGLGMSIVYGIIKQHDGFITVDSKPGNGTCFKIYLPLLRIESTAVDKLKPEQTVPEGKETILVVDDDCALREIIGQTFREFGYTVIIAVDGTDAVEKFKKNMDCIDLVIMDVIMPGINGIKVYDEFKKVRPTVNVLFMSGYNNGIIDQNGILGQYTDYIQKPLYPKQVLMKVREMLDRDI